VPPVRKGLREPWVRRDLKGRPEPQERKVLLARKATPVRPVRRDLKGRLEQPDRKARQGLRFRE